MKKLCQCQSMVEVSAIEFALKSNNIDIFIKNQYSHALAGEVPFLDVMPEIWLLNEGDEHKAKELYHNALQQMKQSESDEWQCAHCEESNANSFETCWKCGALSPT